jgi:hypothetical protein
LQRYVHRLSNITSLQKGVLTFWILLAKTNIFRS